MKVLRHQNRILIIIFYVTVILVVFRCAVFLLSNKNKNVDQLYITENIRNVKNIYVNKNEMYEKWIEKYAKGISSNLGEFGNAGFLKFSEKHKGEESLKKKAVNIFLSNKIPLQRKLKDYRNPLCKNVSYNNSLPTASVVIIFHNEAFSLLLRTVYSILRETPPKILNEIILVDDKSTEEELQGLLEYFVKTRLPKKVKLFRLQSRQGLVNARLNGAKNAVGDVLVFLDAHCEVTKQWLEPLLQRIKLNNTRVVLPIVDNISEQTFEYLTVDDPAIFQVGGFSWSGHFKWINLQNKEIKSRKSNIDPVRTPTMPGGLFAIDKKYFWDMGSYDDKMDGWGGENLEMSFRIWQCGGSLEIVPCSRVGHVFREFLPYKFPNNKDTHGINTARLAEVWMDNYKRFYYFHRKEYENQPNIIGNITHRIKLREKLKCKSFQWYLENIYPEKFVLDENCIAYGRARVVLNNLCLDDLSREENYNLAVFHCNEEVYPTQFISLTNTGQLRKEDSCATIIEAKTYIGTSKSAYVYMVPCDQIEDELGWQLTKKKQIKHLRSGLCLDTTNLHSGNEVKANECTDTPFQMWKFDFSKSQHIPK